MAKKILTKKRKINTKKKGKDKMSNYLRLSLPFLIDFEAVPLQRYGGRWKDNTYRQVLVQEWHDYTINIFVNAVDGRVAHYEVDYYGPISSLHLPEQEDSMMQVIYDLVKEIRINNADRQFDLTRSYVIIRKA